MYRFLYRHLLSRTAAEWMHGVALRGLAVAGNFPPSRALLRAAFMPRTAALGVNAFGLSFAHPLGLAGGFDKDGVALHSLAALGFSFIEVGTVTPQPQAGNPKPRLFRLTADGALINRLGFPSGGMASVARHVARRPSGVPLAISLGKNKDTPLGDALSDYRAVLEHLYPYGDLFVVNVSSPNTPELRRLQTYAYLADLLAGLRETLDAQAVPKPLLLKIAPDLSLDEITTICDLALQYGISGMIATNTTLARPATLQSAAATESGGLSGAPLRATATEIVRHIYRTTDGKLPVIGVGGVFSGADVWEKLRAGAVLVQAYTGFIYEGMAFVRRALYQLRQLMAAEGVQALREVIGADGYK